MKNSTSAKGSTAFFILLIGITIMVLVMIRSFLGVIFFSLTLVFILKPLFDRLVILFRGRKNLAAAATLLITAVVPVLVFSIAGSLLVGQLRNAAASYAATTDVQAVMKDLGSLLESMSASGLGTDTASSEILAAIGKLAGAIVGMLASLGFSILNLLLNLIIVITIVAPLLINYDWMMDWIQQFSLFPSEVDLLFVERIRSMVMAMFLRSKTARPKPGSRQTLTPIELTPGQCQAHGEGTCHEQNQISTPMDSLRRKSAGKGVHRKSEPIQARTTPTTARHTSKSLPLIQGRQWRR
jgi:predicted PurR-regulated permease PerM